MSGGAGMTNSTTSVSDASWPLIVAASGAGLSSGTTTAEGDARRGRVIGMVGGQGSSSWDTAITPQKPRQSGIGLTARYHQGGNRHGGGILERGSSRLG